MNLMSKVMAENNKTIEIERRYLVDRKIAEEMAYGRNADEIEQVYLGRTGEWSVRSRKIGLLNPKFFLTFKRSAAKGANIEIEQEGDPRTHLHFFLMAGTALMKKRYRIGLPSGQTLELDIFENPVLEDLAIAEIELGAIHEKVALPDWLGDEITGKPGFSNSSLFDRLLMTTSIKIARSC